MCPQLFNHLSCWEMELTEVIHRVVQDYFYSPLSQTTAILLLSAVVCLQNTISAELVDSLHLLVEGQGVLPKYPDIPHYLMYASLPLFYVSLGGTSRYSPGKTRKCGLYLCSSRKVIVSNG